ncbi:hypothetical protein FRC18_009149 [Serendipita sp. 400]|nr:hypothetical protein FRC18_009149 [Serendipita sp. 400]
MRLTNKALIAFVISNVGFVLGQNATVNVDACPGYNATNISNTRNGFKADLVLAGKACNVYGKDYERLSLTVTYETGKSR